MRRLLAAVLTVAIQGAVVGASLVHAHPDDRVTAHHRGRAGHAHWAGDSYSTHQSDRPVVCRPAHHPAVFLDAFVAVAISTSATPATTHSSSELRSPAETAAHRSVDVVHGHDPPFLQPRTSRAPPACLL